MLISVKMLKRCRVGCCCNASDQESLNSELSREAQWQAEIDYYNFVIAQARETAERRRHEEIGDNDIQSDIELSVPASSLFNGIEGIETGDAGLADQDGKDSRDDQDS